MLTISAEAAAYHMPDLRRRWEDFFPATRQIIAPGVLASAADYVQAQRVRRVVQAKLGALFADIDLVVMPTTAIASPRYDALNGDSSSMFGLIFTTYWDAVGNPVLVVPMGFNREGLPLSLQIAGRPFDEATVLRAGDAYQHLTDWHLRVPELAIPG